MRKSVTVGLACTFAMGALAACSSNSSPSTSSPAPSAAASSSAPSAAPSEAPKPATINVYSNTGVEATYPQGSNPEKLKEIVDIVKKETGITVNATLAPKGQPGTDKLNVMLSTGENFDLFFAGEGWSKFAGGGAIQPINALLDKYGQNIKKRIPAEAWKTVTDAKGNIWGIPKALPSNLAPVWIRKDWLTKLNLAEPKTIDDLEKIMKAFKENDPDGNGKEDTIVMSMEGAFGKWQYQRMFGGAFIDQGGGNWLDPADKKVKPVEVNPQYKDLLAKLSDWYGKGYIYKESFGTFDPTELLKTNRVGIWAGWISRATLIAPKVNVDYTPYWLTGPKGKAQTLDRYTDTAFVIPKASKNAEAVMRFLDWQFQSFDNYLTVSLGVEDRDWKWVDEKAGVFDFLVKDVASGYVGELKYSHVVGYETEVISSDPASAKHGLYLKNIAYKNISDFAKVPPDQNVIYNSKSLSDAVPTKGDLDRLMNEESIKFIMGARPISDFDKYQDELKKAGVDKLIDEMTKQFNASK